MAQRHHQSRSETKRTQPRGGQVGEGHGRSGQPKPDGDGKQYEGGYEGNAEPGGDYQSGDQGGNFQSGGYAGGFDHPEDFEGGPYQGGSGWGGPDGERKPDHERKDRQGTRGKK